MKAVMEYLFSVLPHDRASTVRCPEEQRVEALLQCNEVVVVRLSSIGKGAEPATLTLPACFRDTPACLAALRLAGQPYVSVRLVFAQSAPMFVRVYVDPLGAASEVARFGTLRAAALWRDLLQHVEQGPFREPQTKASVVLQTEASVAQWFSRVEATFLNTGLPFSLAKGLGAMTFASFDSPAACLHGFEKPPANFRGGVLRLADASPASLELCLDSIPRSPAGARNPQLGAARMNMPCTLVLLEARKALNVAPAADVFVARTLQEAMGLSFAALHQLRAVVLCLASDSAKDEVSGISLAALREWQADAVQVFVQATARAGMGADGALPLSFAPEDQTRYFVAQCPRRPGWTFPWTLIQWERLIVDCDLRQESAAFSAEIRVALVVGADALVGPLPWRAASQACTALGLPALNAHHPDLYAALQEHSALLRVPGPRVSIRAVHTPASPAELQVRQALLGMHPVSASAPHSGALRVALGAHPSPISFEKMVASVHGMPSEKLTELLDMFASDTQHEYAREQLSRLHQGAIEACAVCMCEPPSVMSFCGHTYCAECAQELQRRQEGPASSAYSKCCVCREPIYADDWWRLSPEPCFVRPALLQALLDARQPSSVAPVVVAVASVGEAAMLCARLRQTLGRDHAEVVQAQGAGACARLSLMLASPTAYVVAAVADLCADCLVRGGVRELVVLSAGGPCHISASDGSAQPLAFLPWCAVLGPLVHDWSRAQSASGIETRVRILGDLNPDPLLHELQEALTAPQEVEPARAPRNYDLRSKARRSRTCTGAALRGDAE